MKNDNAASRHAADAHIASSAEIDLISHCARLLFQNGQTTHATLGATARLADALGFQATVFPRLDSLTIRFADGSGTRHEIVGIDHVNVDMSKVVAVGQIIDDVCDGRLEANAALNALQEVTRSPPVPLAIFASMAGAGAAALGVI